MARYEALLAGFLVLDDGVEVEELEVTIATNPKGCVAQGQVRSVSNPLPMISAVRKKIRRKLQLLFYYRARTHRVHCTLRRGEYQKLFQHAQKARKRPTAFLREAALAYLERRYLVPARLEERLGQSIALLRNIATNLNQLSAKANSLKRATVFDLLRARRLVLALEEELRQLVRGPTLQEPDTT